MTLTHTHNVLMNSAFQLWDYGATATLEALPSHGYLANRWKISRLGDADGTVSRGKTLNHASVSKWMRNTNTVKIDATTISPEGTASIAQTVEEAVLWHRGLAVMTVIAHGPLGATFDVTIGGQTIGTITTEGKDKDGNDIYTTSTVSTVLGDLGTASGNVNVEIFTSPSEAGVYQVAFAQLRLGALTPTPQQLEVRTTAQERMLCSRYARPVGSGIVGQALTDKIAFGITHPVPMRVGPTFLPTMGAVTVVHMDRGVLVSADNPSWSSSYATTGGVRLATTGWAGLDSGSQMITTGVIGILHADY